MLEAKKVAVEVMFVNNVWVNIVEGGVLWRRVVLGGVRADAAIDRGGPTSVPLANWRPPRSAALHRHPAAVPAAPTFLHSWSLISPFYTVLHRHTPLPAPHTLLLAQ